MPVRRASLCFLSALCVDFASSSFAQRTIWQTPQTQVSCAVAVFSCTSLLCRANVFRSLKVVEPPRSHLHSSQASFISMPLGQGDGAIMITKLNQWCLKACDKVRPNSRFTLNLIASAISALIDIVYVDRPNNNLCAVICSTAEQSLLSCLIGRPSRLCGTLAVTIRPS